MGDERICRRLVILLSVFVVFLFLLSILSIDFLQKFFQSFTIFCLITMVVVMFFVTVFSLLCFDDNDLYVLAYFVVSLSLFPFFVKNFINL